MTPTMFADRIYNATDLNRRSSELLKSAAEGPITVVGSSSGPVVMQSRDRAAYHEASAFWLRACAPLIEKICLPDQATPLPPEIAWIADLSPTHLDEFLRDFITGIRMAADSGNFAALQASLYNWEATAEVDRDPELHEELMRASSRARRAVGV